MIEKRRWFIVPAVVSAGALAFACSSSSGDDSDSCASGSCAETDSGGVDATTNPNADGSTPSDGSTGDGAVAVGGPPIMLGQHLKTPYALAVDSTYVYIGEVVAPTARVLRVPIAGGTMETIATGFSYANALATDGTSIYVAEGLTGNVYKFPVSGSPDGGVPEKFLATTEGLGSLALSATHLYMSCGDYGHAIFSYEFGTDAAAPPTVFGGSMDEGISIDSTDMFWGEQYTGEVVTRSILPEAGPQFDLVAAQGSEGVQNQLTEVRPLGNTIYWGQSNASGNGIFSIATTVQVPAIGAQMLATDTSTPAHLNVDSKYIYWISDGAVCEGLQYIPLAGGTPKILVPCPDETVYSFTQDANYIYYTHGVDPNDATLVRITKPS